MDLEKFDAYVAQTLESITRDSLLPWLRAAGIEEPERYRLVMNREPFKLIPIRDVSAISECAENLGVANDE